MQMFVMWFIVDSKRDGDANNEKCPSGSPRPAQSLSLLQPRKRIPKVGYNGFELLQALLKLMFCGQCMVFKFGHHFLKQNIIDFSLE